MQPNIRRRIFLAIMSPFIVCILITGFLVHAAGSPAHAVPPSKVNGGCQNPPLQDLGVNGKGTISLSLSGNNQGDTHIQGNGVWGIWTQQNHEENPWAIADTGTSDFGLYNVDSQLLSPGAHLEFSGQVFYRDSLGTQCQGILNQSYDAP